MKRTLFLAYLSLAACSHASYELLLVADLGDADTTARIHRFDPVTRTYLGFFGEGIVASPRGVEVDSNGVAWVGESGGNTIHLFNASTGLFLGTVQHEIYADPYGKILQGRYFWNSSTTLYSIDTTTYAPTNHNTGGAAMFVAPWSSTEFFTTKGTGALLRINALTGAVVSGQALPIPTTSWYADAAIVNDPLGLGTRKLYVGRPSDSSYDLTVYAMSSTGSVTTGWTYDVASLKAVYGVAKAHRGLFVAGKLASDPTRGGVTFIDDQGLERYTFGSSYIKTPRGIGTVLAPEPGTLIAIGVGLAALARTRRRR